MSLAQRLSFLDNLELGGGVALIGLCVVFTGLVLLIIITLLYPKLFNWLMPISARRKENRAAKKAARASVPADRNLKPTAKPVLVQSARHGSTFEGCSDDNALIAVITAAIAASLGTSSNGIRIRSLRRSAAPEWNKQSKLEQFRF